LGGRGLGHHRFRVAHGRHVYWATVSASPSASYVQNTESRVLSGNLNFTGTNVYFTTAAYVGTATVANVTGIYTTGTVNAASYTVGTTFIANTTQVNTSVNTFLTSTTTSGNAVSGALVVSGGIGVANNIYVAGRVGFSNATNISVAYTYYNATTNSLDTVFG
jgi:hypothetical protein